MREHLSRSTAAARSTTVASYGRFRRFDVRADEDIQPADSRPSTDLHSAMMFVELPAGRFTMGSAAIRARTQRRRNAARRRRSRSRSCSAQHEVTQQEWRTVMGTRRARSAAADRGVRSRTSPTTTCCGSSQKLNETSRLAATPDALRSISAADRSRVGVRLPRRHDGTVLDRRKPDDRAGELQRQVSVRHRFPPARTGSIRRRSAAFRSNPVGARRHARQRVGVDVGLVRARIRSRSPTTSTRTARRRGEKRVIRGGSWFFDANSARCALRYTHAPPDKGFSLGLSPGSRRTLNRF